MSENWSGYVAQGPASFSSVSGSWVQPTVNCTSGQGYSAFWVGLGGSSQQSQSLEQTGTQADCSGGGQPHYYAWYELVPAGQVKLGFPINPGDHISASVSVNAGAVTVSLSNQTTGASTTKTIQMSDPDTSSAEWIAEAPAACGDYGGCHPLPLNDFGTVQFSAASATANGHTGPISDPNWSAQAVQMDGSGGPGFISEDGGSAAGAQPSSLSADGSSFSVSWQSASTGASDPGTGGDGYGGYGSGDSGGYGSQGGYGGYGGYGSGDSGGYGAQGGYGGYGGYGAGGAYGYGPGVIIYRYGR